MPRKITRFHVRLKNHRPSDRDVIDDLRRVAQRCRGHNLTFALYRQHGGYAFGSLARRFGTWRAALEAARLPASRDRNVPSLALMENLAAVWRRLGRQPRHRDMIKRCGISRYSASLYIDRFGSWNRMMTVFARFARGERVALPATPARTVRSRRNRASRRISARLHSRVLIRDNCQCRMCGTSPLKDPAITLHVDHILPWSKGGRTALGNLQTLCARCNRGKGDLLLQRPADAARLARSAHDL